MAAAQDGQAELLGDSDDKAAILMLLVEMFPNLSWSQLRMHCDLFPANVDLEFLVDSLIDVQPDGGTPPPEWQHEDLMLLDAEINVPLDEGLPPPDHRHEDIAGEFVETTIDPKVETRNDVRPRAMSKRWTERRLPLRPRLLTACRTPRSLRSRRAEEQYKDPKDSDSETERSDYLTVSSDSEEDFDETTEVLDETTEVLDETTEEIDDSAEEFEDTIENFDDSVTAESPIAVAVLEERPVQDVAPVIRLAEMFPDSPVEALATLCHDNPGLSLAQLVAEFLINQEAQEAANLPDSSLTDLEIEPVEADLVDHNAEDEIEIPEEPEDLGMIQRYQMLLTLFPSADPDFLRQSAATLTDAAVPDFVARTMESDDYPGEDVYRARERLRRLKDKYIDRFNAAAFLAAFPQPAEHFATRKAVVSAGRTENALAYLALRYTASSPEDLAALLERNEGNLSRACEEAGAGNAAGEWIDVLVDNNEDMLQEIAFIEHRREVELVQRRMAESKQVAVIAAQCKKETLTCGCCYGDMFLLSDMAACVDGHLFCKGCVVVSSEVLIGQGKSRFPCLGDCDTEFSMQTLQSVLVRSTFLRMVQRRQYEEVYAAEIPDLETCPACDFSVVPSPEDIVFTCLNPECLLVTCRKCREPSHIPLRCDELPEKEEHTRIRKQLEDRMTQALIRECWKCKKKFVKSDGCNKMQCTCGALMCYLCRQPVKDYSHFNGPGGDALQKCELFSNNEKLHIDAVRDEAFKARAEVALENPNLELKFDPTLLLP